MTAWTDALAVARDEGYSGMPVRGSDLHARALEIMRGGFFLGDDDDDDDTDDDTDDEDMLAVDANDETPGDKALNLISQRYESDSDSDDSESTVSSGDYDSDSDSDSDSTTISTLSSTGSAFQRTMDAQMNNTMPIPVQVDDKEELRQWISTLPLVKRKAFLDRYGSAFIQTVDDAKAVFVLLDDDKGYKRLTQIDPFSQPIMKSGPL